MAASAPSLKSDRAKTPRKVHGLPNSAYPSPGWTGAEGCRSLRFAPERGHSTIEPHRFRRRGEKPRLSVAVAAAMAEGFLGRRSIRLVWPSYSPILDWWRPRSQTPSISSKWLNRSVSTTDRRSTAGTRGPSCLIWIISNRCYRRRPWWPKTLEACPSLKILVTSRSAFADLR